MKKIKYKIKDITPKEHRCVIGACPTIVETNNNSYIIIGDVVDQKTLEKLNLSQKIGTNEIAIEIPKSLLNDLPK
jgi:hypothetical protein